jgi:hypothetical protein
MNKLIPGSNGVATMTSLEIVDFINEDRKAKAEAAGAKFPSKGFAKLEHSDFLKKVPEVLGKDHGNFSSIYQDAYGRSQPSYTFPKREACLMAMSYSYEIQAKVFDRMTYLEFQVAGLPAALIEGISDSVMMRIGGMVKAIVHKEFGYTSVDLKDSAQQAVNDAVSIVVPQAVNATLALREMGVRRGITAGQVVERYRMTKIRNGDKVLSRWLCELGCQMPGRAEMGRSTAKMFDPDKVEAQFKYSGLSLRYEQYVKERKGQLSLFKVVGKSGD